MGLSGVHWASKECKCSGGRRGKGGIMGHFGLLEGVGDIRWSVRGVRDALGLARSVCAQGPEGV